MLFLWFYHACRRGAPRFLMVADHINYLTFEDPGAVNTVRRALKLAHAGDLYGAAETAGVDVAHAAIVSEGLRRGMRFSIGAEVDNDPRARPDAQNIVDAMRPDGIIRTVHFVTIDHPEKGTDWSWPFDNDEFAHLHEDVGAEKLWELYAAKLFDDLEKLPAHIAGHFYSPAGTGLWPAQKKLEEYEDRLLEICHARGLAIEINTRFLYRDNPDDQKKKFIAANERLIRKAKARGVGIAIGSDAHSPKDQGNGFDVVLKMLDDAKVNEIVFPVGGRLARVALRATREHLEAHAKTRETTTPGSSITGYSRAELGLPEAAEPLSRRESARIARETGPKKRASDATRTSKRGDASAPAAKSGSRRTAESSSSSSKAKAARTTESSAKAAAATKKTALPKIKTATKHAKDVKSPKGAKKLAAKPKASKAALKPSKRVKSPPKKSAPVKLATVKKSSPKKAAAKKPAVKAAAKPKKLVAKPASKARAKKAAKKTTQSPSKGSATKKKTAAKRR
jgi:HisJ family histidinol phosphate phosphatase